MQALIPRWPLRDDFEKAGMTSVYVPKRAPRRADASWRWLARV